MTLVGVRPTHRRRGLLTTLMRRQLADIHDAGREPVAALWASEPVIYGRFGYGIATLRREPRGPTRGWLAAPHLDRAGRPARARRRARLPCARARGRPPDGCPACSTATVPGGRTGCATTRATATAPSRSSPPSPRTPTRCTRSSRAGPTRVPPARCSVRDVVAATDDGRGGDLGLPARTRPHRASSPGTSRRSTTRCRTWSTTRCTCASHLAAALWVRLVDLPRALSERAYGEPFEVVLEVADEVCPWNAGRWALRWDGSTATCARDGHAGRARARRRRAGRRLPRRHDARAARPRGPRARAPQRRARRRRPRLHGRPGALVPGDLLRPAGTIGRAARAARARPRRRARWRGRAAPRCRARASP